MSEPEFLNDDLLDEYDFSQARRGNLHQRPPAQTKVRIETDADDREVQIKTVEVTAIVELDGKVTLQLPPDVTPGEHTITLLIQEHWVPQAI